MTIRRTSVSSLVSCEDTICCGGSDMAASGPSGARARGREDQNNVIANFPHANREDDES